MFLFFFYHLSLSFSGEGVWMMVVTRVRQFQGQSVQYSEVLFSPVCPPCLQGCPAGRAPSILGKFLSKGNNCPSWKHSLPWVTPYFQVLHLSGYKSETLVWMQTKFSSLGFLKLVKKIQWNIYLYVTMWKLRVFFSYVCSIITFWFVLLWSGTEYTEELKLARPTSVDSVILNISSSPDNTISVLLVFAT